MMRGNGDVEAAQDRIAHTAHSAWRRHAPMAMRIARSSVKGMRQLGQRSVRSEEKDSMPSAIRSSTKETIGMA